MRPSTATSVPCPPARRRPVTAIAAIVVAVALVAAASSSGATAGPRGPHSAPLQLTVSPSTAAVGGSLTVAGTGFDRKSPGTVTIGGVEVARFRSNPHGRFSVDAVVPEGLEGETLVIGSTEHAVASVQLVVTGDDEPARPPLEPEEPDDSDPGDDPDPDEEGDPDGSGPGDALEAVDLDGHQHPIFDTDAHRSTDQLIVYTPSFGATTGTNQWGVEAAVIDGQVVEVEDARGSMAIPRDGSVLSGHGEAAQFLRDHARIGADVTWTAEQGSTEPEPEPDEPGAEQPAPGEALMWSPPEGWEDYTEVVLPSTGGVVELDSDVDYRISAPEVRTEALHIRGGRNIVWIGGHVRIENQPRFASGISRRAIVFSDATDGSSERGRIIHAEGLLLDGDDLAEGINTNVPSAVVQLQNIRVEQVTIRGADDRDGTGGYPSASHPDVLQLWGSKQELRIDGLTGRSNYQGIFFNEDSRARTRGPNHLRRVNIEMIETLGEDGRRYAGHRGYTWTSAASGRQFLDNGTVWLQTHENSGWTDRGSFRRVAYRDSSGALVDEPVAGSSRFGDNLHPALRSPHPYTLQLENDALGTYAFWLDGATVDVAPSSPAVRNLDDSAPGRIYAGSPPDGDYVPRETVGRSYRSPGYR